MNPAIAGLFAMLGGIDTTKFPAVINTGMSVGQLAPPNYYSRTHTSKYKFRMTKSQISQEKRRRLRKIAKMSRRKNYQVLGKRG